MTATIVSTNDKSGPPSSVLNAFAIETRVTSSPPTRWLKSESTGIGAYNVLMIGSSGPVTFLISLMIGPMTWPNTSPASIWTRLNEIDSGSTPPPESAPGLTLFHAQLMRNSVWMPGKPASSPTFAFSSQSMCTPGVELQVEQVVEARARRGRRSSNGRSSAGS